MPALFSIKLYVRIAGHKRNITRKKLQKYGADSLMVLYSSKFAIANEN